MEKLVLIVTPDYVPEAGGTYAAVRDQIVMQRKVGLRTGVWANRGDGIENVWTRFQEIPWQEVAAINFAAVWHPFHALSWMKSRHLRKPFVVSPHGMFEPYILSRRPRIKSLARVLYQNRIVRDAVLLHATSEAEATNLRTVFPCASVRVIPNAIDTSLFAPATPSARTQDSASTQEPRSRRMLFVSRLHPKKRILELVRWWIASCDQFPEWKLIVASPLPTDPYSQSMHALLTSSPKGGALEWAGFLRGTDLVKEYHNSELFVLPTLSENFGNVIGEALACGLPVVTTTGAPWPILHSEDCGWWTNVDIESFFVGLRTALTESSVSLNAKGARGSRWVAENLAGDALAPRWADLWSEVTLLGV